MEDMEAINVSRKEERERKEAEEAAAKEKKRLFASGITPEEPEVEEGRKEVRIVVKADVSGSSEAVAQALVGVGNDIAGTKVIATGVGDVTESDIMRAKASGGMRSLHTCLSLTLLMILSLCRYGCRVRRESSSCHGVSRSGSESPYRLLDYHLQATRLGERACDQIAPCIIRNESNWPSHRLTSIRDHSQEQTDCQGRRLSCQ